MRSGAQDSSRVLLSYPSPNAISTDFYSFLNIHTYFTYAADGGSFWPAYKSAKWSTYWTTD